MMKFHHRLMLLISSILIISFVTLGIIIHASITYVLSEKHEQALATDARSYIYLVQDNEIDKVKEIVKQQNIDLLITKHDKKVFSSGKLKAIPNSDSYIQKGTFLFLIRRLTVIMYGLKVTITILQKCIGRCGNILY